MNSGTKEAHLNFEDETDSTAITTVLACTETYNRLVQMGIKAQVSVAIYKILDMLEFSPKNNDLTRSE